MEKRKVTILIGGQSCSFYSDDSDDYITRLAQRANAAMKQTARFSGSSAHTNAVLAVLLLADQLLRAEQAEKPPEAEPAEKIPKPEQKGNRKSPARADGNNDGQVSVWDLLAEPQR